MAEQIKKRSMTTDDETWNWNCTQLQLPIIATGAAKDNKMKIFKIISLSYVRKLTYVMYLTCVRNLTDITNILILTQTMIFS